MAFSNKFHLAQYCLLGALWGPWPLVIKYFVLASALTLLLLFCLSSDINSNGKVKSNEKDFGFQYAKTKIDVTRHTDDYI